VNFLEIEKFEDARGIIDAINQMIGNTMTQQKKDKKTKNVQKTIHRRLKIK